MLDIFVQSIPSIIVGLVLLACVLLAIRSIRKGKKNGTSCGCGCSNCASSSVCHTNKK